MPALHEGSRLIDPKRQLHEKATKDCYYYFWVAKLSICHETAKFSFKKYQVIQKFLSFVVLGASPPA